MKPPEEALALFLQHLSRKGFPGSEIISVLDAVGRTTALPVHAVLSSPHFHTAAMDGFAVMAESTFGAGPDRPITLRIGHSAWPVNTGRPLPPGTDAVIMIENVNFIDDETFEIEQGLVPWRHVRRVGEDFVASEMIIPSRHVVTPYEAGALIAGGVHSLEVVRKPKFLFIPTGSELVSPDLLRERSLEPGETLEFNTVILAGIVAQAGGEPVRHSIIPDEFDEIKEAIRRGVESDAHVIVVNAGSSAGSEDYTAAAIGELGEVLVHGVAMMPGKPTILGIVDDKPVIGNPGYPVSAVLSFEVFGLPVLEEMLGRPSQRRPTIDAVVARKIPSKLGQEEFLRMKLGKVGDRVIAAPLPRGAGSITTLTRADGILRIPSSQEGVDQASRVQVELLRNIGEIEHTLVIIGSHDLTLDILADELIERNVFLSSSNVGSLGGLLALKNGTSHMATSHLLDTETGVYNWSYIRRYIPDIPVKVIHGVMREQGFIVPKGNPKSIKDFQDLLREDVTFINRQAGAGTRVLLDYHLERLGLDAADIKGYETEEYTHTSVAVAVLSGVADVGMGVLAAARALDLDFVPVAVEQYDFVIPMEHMEDEKVLKLIDVIRSERFKNRVNDLGGYGVEKTGKEISAP
jgi:putative molybdopterin biosynthesis protein